MRTYPLGGKAHIYINGHDLSEFGAKLETDYAISGHEITNDYYQGPDRSSFLLLRQSHGLLKITLPLDFSGDSKQEVMHCLTSFHGHCAGVIELDLQDGFSYTCMLEEAGETHWLSDTWCTADYQFVGIRHGAPVTAAAHGALHLHNPGSWPRNDCVITVNNLKSTSDTPVSITLSDGNTTFLTWKLDCASGYFLAGGNLVLDGVKKRILYRDGGTAARAISFIDYPYLKPGRNTISVSGAVTHTGIIVDFTPAYL